MNKTVSISDLESEVEDLTRQLQAIFTRDGRSKHVRDELLEKQKKERIKMLTEGLSIEQVKEKQKKELEAFDDGEEQREVRKRKLYAEKEAIAKRIEEIKNDWVKRTDKRTLEELEAEQKKLDVMHRDEEKIILKLRKDEAEYDRIRAGGSDENGFNRDTNLYVAHLQKLSIPISELILERDQLRKQIVKQESVVARIREVVEAKLAAAR